MVVGMLHCLDIIRQFCFVLVTLSRFIATDNEKLSPILYKTNSITEILKGAIIRFT